MHHVFIWLPLNIKCDTEVSLMGGDVEEVNLQQEYLKNYLDDLD